MWWVPAYRVHFSGEFWRTSAKFLELYTTITVQTRVSKEQQTIKYLYVDIISDASIVTVCASTVVGSKSSDPSEEGPIQVPCVSRTSHFVHGCIKSLSHASTAHPEMVSPNSSPLFACERNVNKRHSPLDDYPEQFCGLLSMRLCLSTMLGAIMSFSVSRSSRSKATASFVSRVVSSSFPRHIQRSIHMDVPVLSSETIDVFHLRRTVDSTQDEAKRLLDTFHSQGYLAVIAENQRKGRGTSGRPWVSTEGNLFMTVAIPMDSIPRSKFTLLPLGVGLVTAQTVWPHLITRPTVKWPNDVLIDGRKVAGTLIENYSSDQRQFWLVGIGVNVQSHPVELPSQYLDFRSEPRSATHLLKYVHSNHERLTAFDVGVELASALQEWVSSLGSLDDFAFVSSWKRWADFSVDYELRETGERVKILDVERDGQLRVIDGIGQERLLVADYFF